ncbi:YncE family protein [Actinomadura darangshiensis]|uniref:YncE family protein n=1 Tax=Actinomadura darangshiensis TaxID=705336 RepID=A0A4R5B2C9_9ACTN|nr:YncE family protein [Actinomadura darangshiensis]TDD79153.1 YncE family protein [Actinomadura darangshiensis]
MGGRSRAAALPLAAVLALTGVLAGCESPVPFYRPGEGSPDAPVVGLGGPAPYLRARPDEPGRDDPSAPGGDVPVAPAGGRVYAATGPGMIAPNARGMPARLYVANGRFIDVLDPAAPRVTGRFHPGTTASRVVSSWDLRRLWATDRVHGRLVPVGPRSGRRGHAVRIASPTALYFTPDGQDALVLARHPSRIDVRDPRTMAPRASLPMPCAAEHADFSLGGTALVATCTAAGALTRVDLATRRVSGTIRLPKRARPGDLRLSPDGTVFYVADARTGGVWLVDARRFALLGFVKTGPGARGLAISRDAQRLFVVGGGTVTAVAFRARRVASRWPLPGGGSPVPGGVSSDGTALWLADPAGLVYAVSTRTGRVLRKIRVGGHPTALCVHPQPGRYSLGGTGLYR